MTIVIDHNAGFCFGVERAIAATEEYLAKNKTLYCLGDIVHNSEELERLKERGLIIVSHGNLHELHDCCVLIRAHGEPPETFEIAKRNRITLIDATCPIVGKLQDRIRKAYIENPDLQIVIFGKKGHAEVVGLEGQTEGKAIVVSSENDLEMLDYSKPIQLFSQTTMDHDALAGISDKIRNKMLLSGNSGFKLHNTICRQVAGRAPKLKDFAAKFDAVVFVSGKKSSNGSYLFSICRSVNPSSYFVSNSDELEKAWFQNVQTVGVTGATSTPQWLMQQVAERIGDLVDK